MADFPHQGVFLCHAVCMFLAFAIFMPSGIAIAKYKNVRWFKDEGGLWFLFHRGVQSCGVLLTVIGFGCGVWLFNSERTPYPSFSMKGQGGNPHHTVGLIASLLVFPQPLNAFVRPHVPAPGKPATPTRRAWELLHKSLGYIAVVFGMFNILNGVMMTGRVDFGLKEFWIGITLVLYAGYIIVGVYLSSMIRHDEIAGAGASVGDQRYSEMRDSFR